MSHDYTIVVDAFTRDLDAGLEHHQDGTAAFSLRSDSSAIPDWEVTFVSANGGLEHLRRELIRTADEITTYLNGDRGGPTPETLRHRS